MAADSIYVLVENLECRPGLLHGSPRTIQLRGGSHKHAELVWHYTGLGLFSDPIAH